ncbi:MAPEG family protein [Salaquimonas pukyongi]|uniref:MAPEG family protein n=1 Tax=Salaquimonas pukyongi TaxID=2712698 RepID=UPI00096B9471|nr:MAPEG family protein [Salaquimonas pukyongi]
MDILMELWAYAPDLKVKLLCLAFAAQIVLTIVAYSKLSKARIAAIKAGKVEPETFKATRDEPDELRVFSRAVANQFELPVIFYALVAASLALKVTSWLTVLLAFAFVVFRYLHLQEMTGRHNVFRRRRLFFRSVQIILLMLAEFVLSALLFAQG